VGKIPDPDPEGGTRRRKEGRGTREGREERRVS